MARLWGIVICVLLSAGEIQESESRVRSLGPPKREHRDARHLGDRWAWRAPMFRAVPVSTRGLLKPNHLENVNRFVMSNQRIATSPKRALEKNDCAALIGRKAARGVGRRRHEGTFR